MSRPSLGQVLVPLAAAALGLGAWRAWGWPGLLLVGSGAVFWVLLQVNRLLQTLKKAANRPIGHTDSAVMLQARLARGQTLLQVVGLARAMGQPLEEATPAQPPTERYRWADGGGAAVVARFRNGRLSDWQLSRPEADAAPTPTGADLAPPAAP